MRGRKGVWPMCLKPGALGVLHSVVAAWFQLLVQNMERAAAQAQDVEMLGTVGHASAQELAALGLQPRQDDDDDEDMEEI